MFGLDEGSAASSPLKILRNHLNVAKAKDATVIMESGANSHMISEWADIQEQVATLRTHAEREYLIHPGSVNDGDYYATASVSRKAMPQEVAINALLTQFDAQGFLALESISTPPRRWMLGGDCAVIPTSGAAP